MNFRNIVAAATLAAAFASPAHAVRFIGSTAPTGSEVRDFSLAGLVAADFDLGAIGVPVSATFEFEAADLGAPVAFNSAVYNLTASPIGELRVAIANATFASLGTAQRIFSTGPVSFSPPSAPATSVLLTVPGREATGLVLGDVPFVATPGAIDWTIRTTGVSAGDRFTLTMTSAIPEPGEWAMMLAGLGLLARVVARRRGQSGAHA